MPVTVRSYAKINLGLGIGPVRADGFHSLVTLYQTIEAHDLVTVDTRPILGPARAPRITLSSSDRRVPADARNTAWKMVSRALAEPELAEVQQDVHVHIEKRLPIQGGLGAGSANAAAALLALEQKLGRRLAPGRGLALGAEVGSDVPLFLIGGAVLGLNRGEEVYPVPDLPSAACVVALPEVGVSTPQAFKDWDAAHPPDLLTPAEDSSTLKGLSRALAAALSEPHSSGVFQAYGQEDLARDPLSALVRTGIRNDFEEVVFRLHPFLATIQRLLAGSPACLPDECAVYAALSGSGSAVFGLYRSDAAAIAAEGRLREARVRSIRTRTLPRAEYWARMADV
jgi:4-diphosphocytidyl-2-C-methyl-D-erythritol kinase